MQVAVGVNLHTVPRVASVRFVVVNDRRARPVRAIERLVHQLLSVRPIVRKVQVPRRGIPSDGEETRVLAGHGCRRGDVPKGPRVHELLVRFVVAKEVQAP